MKLRTTILAALTLVVAAGLAVSQGIVNPGMLGPSSSTDNAIVRFDGTTGKITQNSAVTVADTTGAMAGVTSVSRTGGVAIQGTNTNDSAAAGYVGELFSDTDGAVALTTATPANAASFALTAGDWNVWAVVNFNGAGATITTDVIGSISASSASIDHSIGHKSEYRNPAGETDIIWALSVGPLPVSIAGTTTYYCVVQATFTVSTFGGTCILYARRVR